jgi:transposase-like protein
MILACFVLGLSTRKVGEALLPILGRPISPATVSTVAKQLDAVVAAFHARPLREPYRVLMLDGVVLARKTGAGAIRRPVLVALGLRPDGKKEVIDFRLAANESAAEWERFLGDLIRRGLVGDGLEMICVDGGSGLLAALPTALSDRPCRPPFPAFPCSAAGRTRCAMCWPRCAGLTSPPSRARPCGGGADLQAVMNAKTLPQARSADRRFAARRFAARRFADRRFADRRFADRRFADHWEENYPRAVACLRDDLDELLTCWRYKSLAERKQVRTTNAIERRFREVRRRTRPMGVFSDRTSMDRTSMDRTSMDRILFAVFNHENHNQGVSTPLLLTQTF